MKILVTGATGFVGQHFISRFGAENVIEAPQDLDLTNRPDLAKWLDTRKFDAVLHLAARGSVAESFKTPEITREVNVGGTRNLLAGLNDRGFSGRVLLVSTGEVYGAVDSTELPVSEKRRPAPLNPYAQSKVEMESLVGASGEFQAAPFTAIVARAFNHIGPGQNENYVVASFTHQLARRKLGIETGNMKTGNIYVTRDFTDVRDVVRAYEMLLKSIDIQHGEVFNVGSGRETRLQDILEQLIEISGTKTAFEVDASRLRPTDTMRICADVSKLKSTTRWNAEISLSKTLKDGFEAALASERSPERMNL